MKMTYLSPPPPNMNWIQEMCNSLGNISLTLFVGNHWATGWLCPYYLGSREGLSAILFLHCTGLKCKLKKCVSLACLSKPVCPTLVFVGALVSLPVAPFSMGPVCCSSRCRPVWRLDEHAWIGSISPSSSPWRLNEPACSVHISLAVGLWFPPLSVAV